MMQLFFFIIGAGILVVFASIPFSTWKIIHWLVYAGVVGLLILTLIIGSVNKGATRWIPLGPVNLQPSQFAQPLTMISLSFFLTNHSLKKVKNLFVFSLIAFIPWVLIIVEPNLGTSLIFMFSLGMLAIHADLPLKWLMAASIIFMIVAIMGWMWFVKPYQKQRILSFLHPDEHLESSYNARQSIIAVGSGEVLGRGLGHGVQSQLRFLPERQTDFIFASLAEELGFVGSMTVLALYTLLLFFIIYLIYKGKNAVYHSVLVGLLSLFLAQVGVNMGMNMGLLPITGITLPLLSYGGSSLLSFAMVFGILQRIVLETEERLVFQIR